jgi:2-polyprenyl-3-methyl-5-hydroxy-6-metoxy-1,4-benzoquinol methylase
MVRGRLVGALRACPYCGETSALELMRRKKFLMEVLRCGKCTLIFRYPVDSVHDNFSYYQDEYRSATVTELPPEREPEPGAENGCVYGKVDFTPKIEALKALRSSGRVLDFGCSWGYTVRQLLDNDFSAVGFEISKSRAAFGRERLGVQIYDTLGALNGLDSNTFDVISVNHVLEHLPLPKETLQLLARLVADDGLLFIVGPNFTGASARKGLFWQWIGQEHPIAPTADFLRRALNDCGFGRVVCGSGPFGRELTEQLRRGDFDSLFNDGDELLVLAWRN